MSKSQTQAVVIPARRSERRRIRRGLALPLSLGALLAILILLPIVLMFLGAVRTGTFVDPRAQFSLRSLQTVYMTLPFLRTLAVTVGASLLVSLIACLASLSVAIRRCARLANPGFAKCRAAQCSCPRPLWHTGQYH
jgi:iron(III) transport system permease protein